MGISEKPKWPEYDSSILKKENVNFIIQINGKKRGLLNLKKDTNEKELLKIAKNDKNIEKFLKTKKIKKIIFIQNRLMNILVDE